jgi:uncharacterized protein (DUF608 family)
MSTPQREEESNFARVQTAGVPLGGVGAGCVELGRDGRFRNITINNNRSASERIDLSPGAFLAVRAARRGKVSVRILQPDSSLPFHDAGVVAPYTAMEQLGWRGLYPASHYRLEEKLFPVRVNWSAMTPVIPYDHEASTLPLVFVSMYIHNPTDFPYDVSVLLNWENLCGCTRNEFPERRGPIRPVVVVSDHDTEHYKMQETTEEGEGKPRLAGLEFGFRGDVRSNAEGNYCIVSKQQQEVQTTIMGWNERDPRELLVLWNQFHDMGQLGNKISRSQESHSGALCNAFTLPAQKGRSLVFVLAWHCPKHQVQGRDLGHGYVNHFPNAVSVATQALAYYRYYFKAVEEWQTRILTSSMPRWFSKMLINNNYVFSTNALFTAANEFTMMEALDDPITGSLDRRFYGSLGSTLFFPNFDEGELALFGKLKDKDDPGQIFRNLGPGCLHEPNHGRTPDKVLDVNIKFVLMVYRNYIMTGKRFILDHIYPRVRQAMEHVVACDNDGDGLPEQEGLSTTFDRWAVQGVCSYTCSLWIAALRAYARLARRLNHKDEAKKYEDLMVLALNSFERKLWDEDNGYYRLWASDNAPDDAGNMAGACHTGQLAGQWYADFLCLGQLFPPDRVKRALAAMCTLNDSPQGVARAVLPDGSACENPAALQLNPEAGTAWPGLDVGQFASLLICHGYADRGLFAVQKIYKNIHGRRGRVFNQPLEWNLETNDACGWGQDRHMAAPSIWHVLYAMEGFLLNVPDGALWLRPNLPKGVHQLSAPLFTPLCFGWVKYREDDEKGYRQTIHISFDSPIALKTIVLRVPEEVEDVQVRCESNEGTEEVEHIFGYDGRERLMEIMPKRPIMVGNLLRLSLRQIKGKRFQFA